MKNTILNRSRSFNPATHGSSPGNNVRPGFYLGHVYTYTFSSFALETARASTLVRNQGKGHLQVGGFISIHMRNSYFNVSLP